MDRASARNGGSVVLPVHRVELAEEEPGAARVRLDDGDRGVARRLGAEVLDDGVVVPAFEEVAEGAHGHAVGDHEDALTSVPGAEGVEEARHALADLRHALAAGWPREE